MLILKSILLISFMHAIHCRLIYKTVLHNITLQSSKKFFFLKISVLLKLL